MNVGEKGRNKTEGPVGGKQFFLRCVCVGTRGLGKDTPALCLEAATPELSPKEALLSFPYYFFIWSVRCLESSVSGHIDSCWVLRTCFVVTRSYKQTGLCPVLNTEGRF